MISKIAQLQNNQYNFSFQKSEKTDRPKSTYLEKSPQADSFEMSVGYVNDIHGQTNAMLRILSGIKGDLVLSAGDIGIGDEKNKAVNRAAVKFMNLANVKGAAMGNHEMDTKQNDYIDTISEFDGDVLAVNFKKEPLENQTPEDIKEFDRGELDKHLKPSTVVEVKGEKIGIIGASPIDFSARITHPSYHTDCHTDNFEDTIEDIRQEIENLKSQGINKIFLVSHLGHRADQVIAQETDGLDVIIGGHTHELVEDIKEGENLFYSQSGEPVILTEAGKNGKYFGKLNLTFDENGVITKAQNNLGESANFSKNMINQYIFDEILGKPEQIGYIKEVVEPPKSLIEENAHANFMCDAMRYEMGADIAIWNNSGTRSYFTVGNIDSRDIKDIAPFEDRISVANVSEKKLVDMFKHAIEATYRTQGNKPGLMAVSGMNYTVSPSKGILTGMNFIDKDGNEHPIDVNNPREDKFYNVVEDSFMMHEGADFDVLAPKEECKEYPFNKDFLTCEYIKHLNKPVEINQTGRIIFED